MGEKVSIVLVNYNESKYLEDFFKSLHAQTYKNLDVVFVDNASHDDSVEWVRTNEKEVHVIESCENLGFGKGCNIGIEHALKNGADYVLLLNIDTILDRELVARLVASADNRTVTTALTYCGSLEEKEPWYAGGSINYVSGNVHQKILADATGEEHFVEFVSGCCMLIHREIIEMVGYFDDDYFLYYEDTDFCVRLKKAGIMMKYIPAAMLWHKVGGSSVGESEMSCSTQYYVIRNRLLFAQKHADKFLQGNIEVLRRILTERAFFDGKQNEKYKLYVCAGISDFLRGYFGEGYYGKRLIQEHYYLTDDFYELEDDKTNKFFWAKRRKAELIIANSKKRPVIYKVSFEVGTNSISEKSDLQIDVPCIGKKTYKIPGHVEFFVLLDAEKTEKIYFTYTGREMTDIQDGNERNLFFQIINLVVEETDNEFILGKHFLPEEEKRSWNTKNNGELCVINNSDSDYVGELTMKMDTYDAKRYNVSIVQNESKRGFMGTIPNAVRLPFVIKSNSLSWFKIKTDAPIAEEMKRKLCFSLHDIRINKANTDIYWDGFFYPEESDLQSKWRWTRHSKGDISIVNNSDIMRVYQLKFAVSAYEQDEYPVAVKLNGKMVWRGRTGEICDIVVSILPMSISWLCITTDIKPIRDGERDICFRVDNFRLSQITEQFLPGDELYSKEQSDDSFWFWSKEKKSSLKLINNEPIIKTYCVEFTVLPYLEKYLGDEYTFTVNDIYSFKGVIGEKKKTVVELQPNSLSEVRIFSGCDAESDGERTLSHRIQNFHMYEYND